MNRRWIIPFISAWVLLAGISGRSDAQTVSSRDELLALVRGDAGFCLSLQNLREESARWQSSPWLKAVRSSPLGQAVEKAPELQSLARLKEEIKKRFDVDWKELRDDIFGDAIVFAYWPGLPGTPDQEQGLLLVHAR